MALTLQNGIQVWQKVEKFLANANPGAQKAFRGLKEWMVTQKGNPTLQFIPFTAADIVVNTGYSPIGGVASRVLALYAKNPGAGDGTNAYIRVYNDTTNTTNTLAYISGLIDDDNDSFFIVNPQGWAYATDVTISSDTGTDATESAAANAADGFVILMAA